MENANYEKGQEIAYNTSRNYPGSACFIKFGKVTKVTKTTITLENGVRFSKTTKKEMKSAYNPYPSASLQNVDSARETIERARKQSKINKTVSDFTQLIAGRRTGHGDYHLTEEVVEMIQAVNEKLTNS